MRHMRSLLAGRHTDDDIFRQIWLGKLLVPMQQVLSMLDTSVYLDKLANHADRISECYPVGATCANIQPTSVPDRSDRVATSCPEGTPSLERDTCVDGSSCRCSSHRATTPSGLSRPPNSLLRGDPDDERDIVRLCTQVSTGAEICVIPPPRRHHLKHSQFSLQAANSTTINTYGQRSLTLDIGVRFGTYFLTHFGLAVDLKHRKLIDTTTTLITVGIAASEPSVSIQLTVQSSPFAEILKDYSTLTKPYQFAEEVQQTV
ncbi:hypothetical protein SprV_0501778300 [Sparganum proliferum]